MNDQRQKIPPIIIPRSAVTKRKACPTPCPLMDGTKPELRELVRGKSVLYVMSGKEKKSSRDLVGKIEELELDLRCRISSFGEFKKDLRIIERSEDAARSILSADIIIVKSGGILANSDGLSALHGVLTTLSEKAPSAAVVLHVQNLEDFNKVVSIRMPQLVHSLQMFSEDRNLSKTRVDIDLLRQGANVLELRAGQN